jgi:hypothetical protein
MQPGRYKSRILRFWGMPVAANGESILPRPRATGRLRGPVAQPSVAARCTGVVLLRFPAK